MRSYAFLVMTATLAGCGDSPSRTRPDAGAADAPAGAEDLVADADAGPVAGDSACAGWTTLRHLSAEELHDKLASSDPILIDLRIPSDGGIPGTDADIAYSDIDAMAAFIGPDRCADVVVYCATGNKSAAAGAQLVARGYVRVQDLSGGIAAWKASYGE